MITSGNLKLFGGRELEKSDREIKIELHLKKLGGMKKNRAPLVFIMRRVWQQKKLFIRILTNGILNRRTEQAVQPDAGKRAALHAVAQMAARVNRKNWSQSLNCELKVKFLNIIHNSSFDPKSSH